MRVGLKTKIMNTQEIIHVLKNPDFKTLHDNPFFGFSFDMDLVELPQAEQNAIVEASFQLLEQLSGDFYFP